MERLRIHPQGPLLSRVVQGYWRLLDWGRSPSDLARFVEAHVELGVTTCDHADIYGDHGAEAAFGAALATAPGLRERLELVTKCDIVLRSPNGRAAHVTHYDTSREHIVRSVEQSLTRLRTDRIELLLLHRPDPLLDADEVAHALEELRAAGKVRAFGVSNFKPSQLTLLESRLGFPLVTNQVEVSPLALGALEDGTLDQCQERRMAPMAWSCLAGGAIFASDEPAPRRVRAELDAIGAELGVTAETVAYAWVLALPSRPLPIVGSGRLDRLRKATDALDVRLTREQWFRVWVAGAGHDVP